MAVRQLFLVLSLLLAAFFFFKELDNDRYLRGPDAYYYALQADHWARTGEVKIPDSSYVHRIHGLLQKTGLRTETAIRLLAGASLFLLSLLTIFLLAKPLRFWGMALSASWFLISPSLLFTSIEFPKLFSLLLLVPIWLFTLRLDSPRNIYACAPLGISLFTHKASIPIAGLTLIGIFIENFSWLINKRQILFVATGGMVVSGVVYFLLGDHFNLMDLERLGGWSNLSPGFISLLSRQGLPLAIKIELVATLAVFIFSLVWFFRISDKWPWPVFYCIALVLPGFFPFSANEVFGVGERYAMLLPFFFVSSALFLISQSEVKESARVTLLAILLVMVSFFVAITWRISYSHPRYLDPENETYDRITKTLQKHDIPMLIVHRGFNFYYKFVTKKETFHYEPEDHWNKTLIWRLSYRITPDELDYYLTDSCSWDSDLVQNIGDKDYFLIREDCWDSLRSKIDNDNDQDLYERIWTWWRNPSEHRPIFLYNKHKDDNINEAFSTFEK